MLTTPARFYFEFSFKHAASLGLAQLYQGLRATSLGPAGVSLMCAHAHSQHVTWGEGRTLTCLLHAPQTQGRTLCRAAADIVLTRLGCVHTALLLYQACRWAPRSHSHASVITLRQVHKLPAPFMPWRCIQPDFDRVSLTGTDPGSLIPAPVWLTPHPHPPPQLPTSTPNPKSAPGN